MRIAPDLVDASLNDVIKRESIFGSPSNHFLVKFLVQRQRCAVQNALEWFVPLAITVMHQSTPSGHASVLLFVIIYSSVFCRLRSESQSFTLSLPVFPFVSASLYPRLCQSLFVSASLFLYYLYNQGSYPAVSCKLGLCNGQEYKIPRTRFEVSRASRRYFQKIETFLRVVSSEGSDEKCLS